MGGQGQPANGGAEEPPRSLSLRPIRREDEDFLCRVYASTRAEELAPLGWSEEQKASFLRMQFEAQHRYYLENYQASRFDVILWGGEAVGRLYVARWSEEIRIIDVSLLPPYRGKGIGSALLGQLAAEADARGLPLRIHVERANPARALYERLGFQEVADRGVYLFLERKAPPAVPASPPRTEEA